jgi:3-isopropylmalate dehydrogenase
MTDYRIAVIPGDGIGSEVTAEAVKVLKALSEIRGFGIKFKEFPFGAEYYLKMGEALPKGAYDLLGEHDALMLGAIGDPRVPMGPLEQELLLALRFHFDQYLNLRPAKSFPKIPSPLSLPEGELLDILVVRENTEDFYMNLGGEFKKGDTSPASSPNPKELSHELSIERAIYKGKASLKLAFDPETPIAFSLGILSEPGIQRIARKAFTLARGRGESFIHSATKSNALPHIYGFWDRIVGEIGSAEFPDIKIQRMNVDNMAYQLARNPKSFGTILCPNLFGDIISDLAAGLIGGLGLAPSGNIGDKLSMFEPVHGSAPDIAGTGKANPLAAILSGGLLLEHLGEREASKHLDKAVRDYLSTSQRKELPIELGGNSSVTETGDRVAEFVRKG